MMAGYANVHAAAGTKTLRYTCMRDALDYGVSRCQSLSGAVLDSFVCKRLLLAVSSASLELSLAAGVDIEHERKQLDDHWQQRLTRSRYDVEQARRQYNAVDPDHRLVTRELERRWDESLRVDERLQVDYAKFAQDCPKQLSSEERAAIVALSNDLPALWHASTTSPEDRQSGVRLLLEEVVVSLEGNTDHMEAELRWAGGFVSRYTLLRPVQTYRQLSNFDELVARIDALRRASQSLREIASTPNAEGLRPPKRSPEFTAGILSGFLRERGIRTGPQPRSATHEGHLQPNEWWLCDLAAKLQMPIATMHRWQRVGWVTSRKVKAAGNRWAIIADAEELARMALLRNSPRGWPNPYSSERITPKPAPDSTTGTTFT